MNAPSACHEVAVPILFPTLWHYPTEKWSKQAAVRAPEGTPPQRFCAFLHAMRLCRLREGNSTAMLLILALLLVLILFGAGFAVHLLWIAAVVFAVLWLVGFAVGRGEGAGHHHFYRW